MFDDKLEQGRSRWTASMGVSVALHVVFLLALLHRAAPIFVAPSSVAHGNGKKSYHIVYMGSATAEEPETSDNSNIAMKAAPRKKHRETAQVNKPSGHNEIEEGDASDHSARAGTRYGSLMSGPALGHEVRPALPVVFPDPPVSRSELPPGFQGDVIVEVTIDEHGAIIEMKVLKSIGHAIDEKVLATLQNWRYTPATMDGIPIVSKHDVHFHFPG
jgi:TonB family protein